jgi:putative redox protein
VSPEIQALEITLQYTEGARFVAQARQHRLVVDQPAEDGGGDHGMTPSELLLTALGSCVGQYVAQYLKLHGLPSDGLLVGVEAKSSARPLRIRNFEVRVIAPGLSDRQLRALEKSFPTGLVQNAIAQENALHVCAVSMDTGDVQA